MVTQANLISPHQWRFRGENMVQILVSTVNVDIVIPVDPDNIEGGTETVQLRAINEVTRSIPDGRTASISGTTINITPDTIIDGGALDTKIVEVDSLPDDWKPHSYLYDGTTWSTNPNYAKLKRGPTIPEHARQPIEPEPFPGI